jgi:hypothetical protein
MRFQRLTGAVNSAYLLDASVTAAKMGANGTWAPVGSVIQVVNSTYASQATNNTNIFADTGLTATITPKLATSKILVCVNQAGVQKQTNNTWVNIQLYRGSTAISFFTLDGAFNGTTTMQNTGSYCVNYLDSPATTSATTYKTQFYSGANNASAIVQISGSVSSMTLLEIAQ